MEKTRHVAECRRVFSRYDMECPRCRELAAGAEPRRGWGPSNDARRCAEISGHFQSARHLSGGCGVVCTFGEW